MSFNGEGSAESLLATQLDELRHRLRNHLQNMTSLITLQIKRAQQPETVTALEDLRVRFATLTSIYIDLDNASHRPIELDRFIPDLVRRVAELYDPTSRHTASCRMAPASLPHNRAAILGQIVVELIMNIYRHAFADGRVGTIQVELTADQERAVLSISDNGPGLSEPDPSRVHLGFRIVSNLATALGGTFERGGGGGFEARIAFPLGEQKSG